MENTTNNIQATSQKRGNGALAVVAIIGMLVGVGGACFGVYGMLSNPKTSTDDLKIKIEKTDGTVIDLDADKIKEVSDDGTIITITDDEEAKCVDKDEFTAEKALKLLDERNKEMKSKNADIKWHVSNANLYARNSDSSAYWVTYTESNEGYATQVNVIFRKDADGEWEFDLPGFSGWTSELEEEFSIMY